MKLCYQVATPDVAIAPSVTAFQGDLEYTFGALHDLGYDGVEFMTLNPNVLDLAQIDRLSQQKNLDVVLICTGEVYGQLKISVADKDEAIRREAIKRLKEEIDFASHFGAMINIGRVRGQYCYEISRETTYGYAVDGFKELADYAEKKNVKIALESINILQSNFLNTIPEAVELIKDVGSDYFGVMYDVFHMNTEEADMYDTIARYKDFNLHIHLSDSNRRYPGGGNLDFDALIKAIKDTGYDGAFCTEIMQIPDQDTAAKRSIETLAPIFQKYYGRPMK